MNYYIQGDAANADRIRAAFEKLGYDTSRHLFNAKSVLYFTLDGEIRATTYNCTPAIIKTHPDYKELQLPVEPKFKVGDWVVIDNCHNSVYQVDSVREYDYMLKHTHGGLMPFHFSCVERLRLWTIQDAKDGDVLVTTKIRSCPFIYRKTGYNNDLAYYYAGIDGNGDFCEGCLKRTLYHFGPVANVAPATKEQCDLLFAKMREAGYEQFIDFKKEVEKLKEIDGADEYAKQLAHLFLGNGLSLQTILLMAIDFGQQHPQWIPVKEELPKETGWYLVATPTLNSKIDVALWDGKWRRLITITHWLPLPQPPRKEE